MNADGTNQTRLTHNAGDDGTSDMFVGRQFGWSPDGAKIVFATTRDGNWEIYSMNADGTDQARLTNNPAQDTSPKWSPDGTKITFVSDRAGNEDIYTMNSNGSVVARLTRDPADQIDPDWQPLFHSPAEPLHITTPNTASRWGLNTTQRLAWTYAGDAPQFLIEISRNGGDSWDFLSVVPNRPGDSQNFDWTVTDPSTNRGRLRVAAVHDEQATDVNDADIRISEAVIEIFHPSLGTIVALGTRQVIYFRHNVGALKKIAIDVSADGRWTWRTDVIGARTTGNATTFYSWIVDVLPATRARVRVRALDGSGASAVSNLFTVVAPTRTHITEQVRHGNER